MFLYFVKSCLFIYFLLIVLIGLNFILGPSLQLKSHLSVQYVTGETIIGLYKCNLVINYFRCGSCKTQIDYCLIRASHRSLCRNCKVIPSECVGT